MSNIRSLGARLSIVTVLVLLAVVGLTELAMAGPQNPPSAPVTVVNTPSNPVPVVQQGTSSISGNVNVNNQPTVKLAPGTNVGLVTGEPFARPVDLAIPVGYNSTGLSVEIPAGKRFVIKTVSATAVMEPGGTPFVEFQLNYTNGGPVSIWLPMHLQGARLGFDHYVATVPVMLDADGPSPVFVSFNRDVVTGLSRCFFVLAGHLVDIP